MEGFFNPEAIGVFGLITTVWCFGLEQLGFGIKDGDHQKIGASLAYVAIVFGGAAQIFTALDLYLLNPIQNGDTSIYLGTVFATYGLFWVTVGVFFLKGGDKKMMAHFFATICFMTVIFVIKAFQIGAGMPLKAALMLIVVLTALLPFAWYGVKSAPMLTKICGLVNILIGIAAVPLLLHALHIM